MKGIYKYMSYKQNALFIGKLAQDDYNFRLHVLSTLVLLGEQLNELSRVKGLREVDYTAIQDAISEEVVDSENSTS